MAPARADRRLDLAVGACVIDLLFTRWINAINPSFAPLTFVPLSAMLIVGARCAVYE